MKRRDFIAVLGLLPGLTFGQSKTPKYADMHAHLGFSRTLGVGYRERMAAGGMLLVAEKITPDSPLLRIIGNRFRATREARPGELRRNFEMALAVAQAKIRDEGLGTVDSAAALELALAERRPSIVIAAEGADFLEGDLGYLDKVRAQGLTHLQIVHYYPWSLIGDIATEPPQHGGVTPFGKELVRACNRLGILVDVAHCSNQAMEQALDASGKPVVYSHGHISAALPNATQSGGAARAIHAPVAKRIAERGGVVGIWPEGSTYANFDLFCSGIARAAELLGTAHVGIGSDMHGLPRTVMPSYAEFAALDAGLARQGMKAPDIEGILGGNYFRVLRQAMTL